MARGNAARHGRSTCRRRSPPTRRRIAADSTELRRPTGRPRSPCIDMGKLTPDSVREPGARLALRARRGAGAARRRARPEERGRVLRPGQRHRTRRADQEPEGTGAAGGGDPAGRPDGHRARPVARRRLSRAGPLERRDHAPVERGALLRQVVHGRRACSARPAGTTRRSTCSARWRSTRPGSTTGSTSAVVYVDVGNYAGGARAIRDDRHPAGRRRRRPDVQAGRRGDCSPRSPAGSSDAAAGAAGPPRRAASDAQVPGDLPAATRHLVPHLLRRVFHHLAGRLGYPPRLLASLRRTASPFSGRTGAPARRRPAPRPATLRRSCPRRLILHDRTCDLLLRTRTRLGNGVSVPARNRPLLNQLTARLPDPPSGRAPRGPTPLS